MSITYHHPSLTFTYYSVIPHPDGQQILLVSDGDSLSLPYFIPEEHHFGVVEHINAALREKYNLRVAVLRCLGDEYMEEDGGVHRYYALDNLAQTTRIADNLRWVPLDAVVTLPLSSSQKRFIDIWQKWRNVTDERRAPWSQDGWFIEAQSVLYDFADRMDMKPQPHVEQVRAWGRSSVLRVATEEGYLYLKAVPAPFVAEVRLNRIFSLRYPPHIPRVLAVDTERGWMMMDGFAGQLLSNVKDVAIWERVLKRYARMQIDLDKSESALINMGVPERHVDKLATDVERLAAELPAELSDDEQDHFRRNVRLLRSMCYELTDYKLPATLTHGDFWPGNIIVRDNNQEPIFFDWSDSSVSHPFFDLPFFLDDIEDMLGNMPDIRTRLRDAYLSQWTSYETAPRLRHIFNICKVLGPLHYALTYHDYVLPAMMPDVRWEMSTMLPLMIRKTMSEFDQYQAASQ